MKKRWKIGIIGTDGGIGSGHSREVCAYLSEGIYSAAVTAVYGEEREEAEAVAKSVGLCAAPSAAAVIDAADAVMIMHRDGRAHTQYALACLQKGIPVFVDKPLCCSVQEAEKIVDAAEKNHTALVSGSAVSFSPAVAAVREEIRKKGAPSAGYLSFPLNDQPEYGGIHFYTHHLLCAAYAAFGEEIRSVTAHRVEENAAVVAKYKTFPLIMNFAANYGGLHIGAYFKDGTAAMQEMSLFETPRLQLEYFIKVLSGTAAPQSREELLWPVRVSCAIEQSLKCGREIKVQP